MKDTLTKKEQEEYIKIVIAECGELPTEPQSLKEWERALLYDIAYNTTRSLPEDGSRWCRSNRRAVVYSALCSMYRIRNKK